MKRLLILTVLLLLIVRVALLSQPGAAADIEPLCTYFFGMNTAQAALDDILVRKALSASTERQTLLQYLTQPGQAALTFTPPGVFGHVDGYQEGVGIPFNPGQAQQWLADAGHPDGQNLPELEIFLPTLDNEFVSIAVATADNWQEHLNVDTALVLLPESEFLVRLQTNPPTLWYYRACTDEPDQIEAYFYLHDYVDFFRPALGDWHNATYEDLLGQAANASDPAQRQGLYKQAEKILVETDAVLIPLIYTGPGPQARLFLPTVATAH